MNATTLQTMEGFITNIQRIGIHSSAYEMMTLQTTQENGSSPICMR
jgi:hypothetical protein